MNITLTHVGNLQKLLLECGCIMHPSGIILGVCKKHQREVDPDRILSLMLTTNAKIAAVIERIDAADMIGMEPFRPEVTL